MKNPEYETQMRLTALNLLGELPNFFALLFSAITTKAVLVFVDLSDTASNVLRNIALLLISNRLRKDLRFKYNYGVGKIEAMTSMLCDFFIVLSLAVMMGFAVRDLVDPRPVSDFVLFALCVKIINLGGDIFVYHRQKKICKKSDSLVFRSALSVALKNILFDSTTLIALLLMQLFGDHKVFWYVSPVFSLGLGGYLLVEILKRLGGTFAIMLDRTTDPEVQSAISRTLAAMESRYSAVENVRSRINGGKVVVDLALDFHPDTTYQEIKQFTDDFSKMLAKKVPACEVSLHIHRSDASE